MRGLDGQVALTITCTEAANRVVSHDQFLPNLLKLRKPGKYVIEVSGLNTRAPG
jgi:hypothetical protein